MKVRISLNEIPSRDKISIGVIVQIVQKQDQRTGNLTEGKVKRILTSSQEMCSQPHSIRRNLMFTKSMTEQWETRSPSRVQDQATK